MTIAPLPKLEQRSSSKKVMRNSSKDVFLKSNETPETIIEKEEESDVMQQVIQQAIHSSQSTLKPFFYLEYKQKFDEGQSNPIVYSKFGKQFYGSLEKFDPKN